MTADGTLEEVDHARLRALVRLAPDTFRIFTNLGDGVFECNDPVVLERFYTLRDRIVAAASEEGVHVVNLAPILLELAAGCLHDAMSRETFLRNAEFWFDTVSLSSVSVKSNTTGGAS